MNVLQIFAPFRMSEDLNRCFYIGLMSYRFPSAREFTIWTYNEKQDEFQVAKRFSASSVKNAREILNTSEWGGKFKGFLVGLSVKTAKRRFLVQLYQTTADGYLPEEEIHEVTNTSAARILPELRYMAFD